jgi:hypothetical protein
MRSFFFILIIVLFTCYAHSQSLNIQTNQVIEWQYVSAVEYSDPFNDIDLNARILHPDGTIFILPAFWAGGNVWKFRFSSPNPGEYKFITECNDTNNKDLHKKKGKIQINLYAGSNPLYTHGAIHVSDNKKYLQHHDGAPFFWLADSWWHGMTKRFEWPDDFKYLVNDRITKGFTVIQFAIGFPCDIEPFDPRGQNEAGDPWDKQWRSIRPAYFDLTDLRIQHLIDKGMVPNIVGAWGYYIKWAGVDAMQKHWKYLIARYGAYPVIWTLAGESTLAWYPDLSMRWEEEKKIFRKSWSEVAGFIREKDPYRRLLTVHPGPISGEFKPIDNMAYIDMFMCQSGHDGYFDLNRSIEFIQKAQKLFPDKPVIHGEVCFEGMNGRSLNDVQRFLFWSNIMMGTPGFSYGAEGIWQFNTEEHLFGPSPMGNVWGNVPWEEAHAYRGSTEIGLGKKFLENYDWWKITPVPHRLESRETDPVKIPFCAEIKDEYIFIYMFRKPARWSRYLVNGLESDKSYSVTWFNPITGEVIENDTFSASTDGKIDINRVPVMQDWVLIIHLKN